MIPPHPGQLTVAILNAYYPSVKSLHEYLDVSLLESLPTLLDHLEAPKTLREFLVSTYVGSIEAPRKSYSVSPPMRHMRDVLEHAQEMLIQKTSKRNIITLGFNKNEIVRPTVYVNATTPAFLDPQWEDLLSLTGESIIIHLLTSTSIFAGLPNACLCQIAGEPITFLKPKTFHLPVLAHIPATGPKEGLLTVKRKAPATAFEEEELARPLKRSKTASFATLKSQPSLPAQPRFNAKTPADIQFSRTQLLYSKPIYTPDRQMMVVGLPPKHILSRISPAYIHNPKSPTGFSPRDLAIHAQHLSKYVFARQYNLATPFKHPEKAYTLFVDYTDRECELKLRGSLKTPKRLKGILPELEKLIRRHARCGYKILRDKTCPSKLGMAENGRLDESVLLEMMSETTISQPLRTQPEVISNSFDSNGNTISFTTTRERLAQAKPRFAEFMCSHYEVYRYIALITQLVIPKSFWGSKANFNHIMKRVKEFISCRRYETLSLHYVLQGLSTAACDWLIPPGSGMMKQARVSVSDFCKRRELLEDFVFWYFDSFVSSVLKTSFYITESSAFRNQVLYFRHDDWHTLCAPLVAKLTANTFAKMTDHHAELILSQRALGYSFVRLLPKETGVRPIVNLRRKGNEGKESINQILQTAFSILNYEKQRQSEKLGASVLGMDDIYSKLKSFKQNLSMRHGSSLPRLYFVKVDVQACFDTIDQGKLLRILHDIISQNTYPSRRHCQISSSVGKVKRTFLKRSLPEDEQPHFLRSSEALAQALRNTIFIDQASPDIETRKNVLSLLEEHITENIVKINGEYFRQTVGIPQGSVLSSLLCSFFYGDLERSEGWLDDPQTLVLRLIDDYLFVTTNLQTAHNFLDKMTQGHPDYGCFISPDKTLTNFDYNEQILNVVDRSERVFPWCGLLINMTNLSVSVDYSRYNANGIRCTLTVDRGRKPGTSFLFKVLQMAKAKSHPIYSDGELNPPHTVYINIYQNFLLTATKIHEYILEFGVLDRRNSAFLRNTIESAIKYNYASLRAQSRRKGKTNSEQPLVHKDAVAWLGNHAFQSVLGRTPQRYRAILHRIEFELKRSKYRRYCQTLKAVVRESHGSFVGGDWR